MADINILIEAKGKTMINDINHKRLSLKAQERLKSRKAIERVFASGEKIFEYPLLMRWKKDSLSTAYPVQLLVSVSKKQFKKATDRVRIKRLLREAYRKNKLLLYDKLEENQEQLLIAIVYTGKKMPAYKEIEEKIIILLQRLSQHL